MKRSSTPIPAQWACTPRLLPLCVLCLAGCVPSTVFPLAAGARAEVAVFHRTVPDLLYSAVSGRNCSLVRLDESKTYCKPVDPPVAPIPYCTRSLAGIDCWAHPELIPGIPAEVAQGPRALTPEQDRARLARWPE